MNVFDSLKTKQAAVVIEATAAWDVAVVQFAADPATTTEKAVAGLLKLTGKSVDELQAAVARQTRINELRGEIAEYPKAVAEHIETGTKLHTFLGERIAEMRRLDAELSRCRGAERGAEYRVQQLQESASELRRLTGLPVILTTVAKTDAVIAPMTDEVELLSTTRTIRDVALPSDM